MKVFKGTFVFSLLLGICINLKAQDFPLNENMNICFGECFDYSVEPDSNFSSLQIIRYLDGGAPWIIYSTTESIFTICWGSNTIPGAGGYLLSLEMTFTDNTTMAWEFLLNAQASSTLEHVPVAGVCPILNSSNDDYAICESNSSSFALTPQGPFVVIGEQLTNIDSYTFNGNLFTVNWGSGSFGALSLTVENEDGTGPSCGYTLDISADFLTPPEAIFSTLPASQNGILQICEGQTVFFQNNSTNAQNYEWVLAGASSDDVNVEQLYETPGTYEATLIAYNDCLCSDTTSIMIEVTASESPLVDCVGTICEGETVSYTSDADCGTFNWNVSSNGSITDGGTLDDSFITVDWGNGPVGTIELTVSNCNSFSFCLEPTIMQVPIISEESQIYGPERVCKRAVVQYTLPAYSGSDFVWSVSTLGDIINGQGTNEITVEWSDQISFTPQFVEVDFENCYLGCGGSASLVVDILPDFFALGSIEVCENGTTQHQAFSTLNNNTTSANWQIFDENGAQVWTSNTSSSSLILEWNFPPGNYILEASPENATAFCSTGFRIPVNVVGSSPLIDGIEGEINICPGSIYTYEAISSLIDTRFFWEINNGGNVTIRQGNPINIQWAGDPPHALSVSQVATNGLDCESAVFTQEIEAFPALAINGSADVCSGQSSIYTTQANESIDYEWSINPPTSGIIVDYPTSNSVQIAWQTIGFATILLNGCNELEEYAIDIKGAPQPVVSHPSVLCPNEIAPVQTVTSFDSYSWRNADGGVVSSEEMPLLGPGYYQLVVEDQWGCIGDTTFNITAHPTTTILISTPDATVYCNTLPDLTFYALNVPGVTNFQWLQNGNPVGGNDQTFQTNAFGNYQVEVTLTNGCQLMSNTISVIEDCSGGGPSGEGCTGMEASFDITPTEFCNVRNYLNQSPEMIPGTVQWNFDDPESGASNFSGLNNPSHIYSSAGFFDVLLGGAFINPNGAMVTCGRFRTDTVVLATDFAFEIACPGDPVRFFDLSTVLPNTTISSWVWDFGDPVSGGPNISNETNPSHNFSSAGSYNVSLTVTAATGCMANIVKTIEVPPDFLIDIEAPTNSCLGTAISFVANTPANVTYLRWDFGDPASGAANQSEFASPYHVFDQVGIYTVSLFTQNIYGCISTFSRDINIVSNVLEGEVTLSIPSPICEGDTTILTAPLGGVAWQWSNGETTSSIAVTETDIYSVRVFDTEGCSYSPAIADIDVFPAPESSIRVVEYNEYGQPLAIYYDQYEACEGADVYLETPANPNYTFEWSNGIFGTETEFSEVRGNQLESGSYDIFLYVTDTTTNCSFEVGPYSIIIHPVPGNVEISVNPSGLICENTIATFSIENPDPSYTYLWNTGQSGINISASQAGEYYATAITEFGCFAQSNHLEITSGPDITKIPSGCHTRCRPDTLCLPMIPGVISYQWFFEGNPIAAPNGTMPELVAVESGNYWLEMVSTQGCTLTSGTLTLDLFDGFGAVEGQVFFDVNNNGVIDATDTLVSGIDIRLLDTNQQFLIGGTSDTDGAYTFANIVSTTYTLEVDTNSLPEYYGVIIPQVQTELIGCDAESTVNWLLFLDCVPVENSLAFSLCEGQSVEYNGVQYSTDTTFAAYYTAVNGCDSVEIVNIQLNAESFLDLPLQVCEGEAITFEGIPFQAGDQMDFLYVDQNGCDSTVRLTVSAYPDIIFDFEVEKTCPNEASGGLLIEAVNSDNYVYSLDALNFQSDPIFENLNAGVYQLTIQDANGCVQDAEFEIETIESLIVSVKDVILDCDLLEVELEVEILSGDTSTMQLLWEDGTTNTQRIVSEPGAYTVLVSDNCQSIEKEIKVEFENLGLSDYFYVPNAFSPNNDGINDEFKIQLGGGLIINSFELQIFDRWGNQVFVDKNLDTSWDGQFRGKNLTQGVYVWYLKATLTVCGQEITEEKFGDVALLR